MLSIFLTLYGNSGQERPREVSGLSALSMQGQREVTQVNLGYIQSGLGNLQGRTWGNLLHGLTVLSVKNFFLIPRLNLSCFNVCLLSLILLPRTKGKSFLFLQRHWKAASRSPPKAPHLQAEDAQFS